MYIYYNNVRKIPLCFETQTKHYLLGKLIFDRMVEDYPHVIICANKRYRWWFMLVSIKNNKKKTTINMFL